MRVKCPLEHCDRTVSVSVDGEPRQAGIDPSNKWIDRVSGGNRVWVGFRANTRISRSERNERVSRRIFTATEPTGLPIGRGGLGCARPMRLFWLRGVQTIPRARHPVDRRSRERPTGRGNSSAACGHLALDENDLSPDFAVHLDVDYSGVDGPARDGPEGPKESGR